VGNVDHDPAAPQATLVQRAYAFAARAHRGQLRKDGRAFIGHPVAVARLLAARGYDAEVVAAGLLHDVVEDTDVTLAQLRRRFGRRVAELVACVTEDPALAPLQRKLDYRERLRRAPAAARAVCAADKVCNLSDLHEAARSDAEPVLARFSGGLDAQVVRFAAELSMLEDTDADEELRAAMRFKLGALRAQSRRRRAVHAGVVPRADPVRVAAASRRAAAG
jgi:(p)ppGpp synthase/HD superfamily hydrolase